MKTLKAFLAEGKFDFKVLDGPRSQKVRGGSVGLVGADPKDALFRKYTDDLGCDKVSVVKQTTDGLYIVTFSYPGDSFTSKSYYRLDESKKTIKEAKELDWDCVNKLEKIVASLNSLNKPNERNADRISFHFSSLEDLNTKYGLARKYPKAFKAIYDFDSSDDSPQNAKLYDNIVDEIDSMTDEVGMFVDGLDESINESKWVKDSSSFSFEKDNGDIISLSYEPYDALSKRANGIVVGSNTNGNYSTKTFGNMNDAKLYIKHSFGVEIDPKITISALKSLS